uniref:Cullin-5 n=1 Tax=Ditylenchus dipsaci TaxID=166011 RepID=A0A915EB78_9BILA
MNLRPRRVDFDEVWKSLKATVEDIVCLQPLQRITWDHNFSDIYFLCVSIPEAQGRRLYYAVQECLENHTRKVLETLLDVPSEDLLKEYNKEWCKFHKGALYLQNLFGYLNKQLAKEHSDAESQHIFLPVEKEQSFLSKGVGNLALDIWKTELIVPLSHLLIPYLIEAIEKDRIGNANVGDIHGAVMSFVQVNDSFDTDSVNAYSKPSFSNHRVMLTDFYQKIFEEPFLSATANHYKFLTDDTFANLDCSAYMERVIQKTDEERSMARKFLHVTSLPKIERMCSEYLVNAQLDRLNAVCRELIQKEELKDLRNMHILLLPLNSALSLLVREFEEHVKKEGMELVAAAGIEPSNFVANIQTLHAKFTKMVEKIFDDDGEFVAALDRALQHVVNYRDDPKQPPKVAERLNRYIDGLLRKSAKGLNESDIDACLTSAITIFRYIDDKDLFQKYYSKMLSNRLIVNLSLSMDFEESMISKMKEACGYEFTNKLSRMFTDIGLSRQLSDRFNEDLHKRSVKLETPISVMVLQAGAWPLTANPSGTEFSTSSSNKESCDGVASYTPPPMLQQSLKHFEEFYATHHTGRKLSWLCNNSVAEVRLNYLDKAYMVTMNVYQLSILMVFADKNSASISTIAEITALPTQTVLRCLKGFLDGELLTLEQGKLDESSVINLNMKLQSRRLRFKILAPQSNKPQEKEVDATCNTLQQDRKYFMECVIVRIMKSRKVMKHNALIDEVIKQTTSRFLPDVSFIKKNIESLIEKLYISRTDLDEYQYLA